MKNKNEKIKVAIIEPIGGHGGMDCYDYGLAYGLGANGIEVDYYTCSKTQTRKFKQVKTFYTFRNLWNKPKLLKLFYYLYYYGKTIRDTRRHKSDIVHLHFFSFSVPNLMILLMLRFRHLTIVVTVHDIDSFHGSTNNWIEKTSYRLINGVIVHNQSSYNDLLKKKIKLPLVAIIPHGNYVPFVNKLPSPALNDNINLLFFGQIKKVKGLDILLNAFAEVIKKNKNFRLIIAGRPWKSDPNYYEEIILKLGISNFVERKYEYIEENELKFLFSKTHIAILPYKRIYQSGVLLLAMSYGRACITSDLPAFREIIEDNYNGFLFESENKDDLKDVILSLTLEKIKRVTFNAVDTINTNFDWVNIGKKTKEFYNSL